MSELLLYAILFLSRISEFDRWSHSNILALLLLPTVFFLTVAPLSAPSPDYSLNVIGIILFFYFIKLIEFLKNDSSEESLSRLKLIFIIAVLGITWKLSIIVYAFFISLLAFIFVTIKTKSLLLTIKKLLTTGLFIIFILLVWCIKGYFLSGAPFFPSTCLWLNTKWAMPKSVYIDVKSNILAWARQPWSNPPFTPKHEVLANWNWLRFWIIRNIKYNVMAIWFIYLCGVGLLLNLCLIFFRRSKINIRKKLIGLIGYIPLFSGVLFWFFIAPDVRFALFMFVLSAAFALSNVCLLFRSVNIKFTAVILCVLVLAFPFGRNLQLRNYINKSGYQPIPVTKLKRVTNDYGFTYYYPVDSNEYSCWNSPLPSSYYRNPRIRLIGDKIEDGIQVVNDSN